MRSPTNYATSYLDLDFVYGRSEEEAEALRTLEGGLMSITDAGLPLQNADGTWQVRLVTSISLVCMHAVHVTLSHLPPKRSNGFQLHLEGINKLDERPRNCV